MELNLKDRVAFITGANRGIGAGIAKAFAAEGVHLGLFARNVQQCEDMAEQIRASTKIRISVQHIDFGQPETLVPAVSGAVEILGGVDILVNCAGGAKRGHFHEVSDEDWETCFSVKPLGLIRMTRAVLPYLERSNQPGRGHQGRVNRPCAAPQSLQRLWLQLGAAPNSRSGSGRDASPDPAPNRRFGQP
jgi:NAD(P)-dependent dehydrogenase (short-subunit alcohol dehydrogenase family)